MRIIEYFVFKALYTTLHRLPFRYCKVFVVMISWIVEHIFKYRRGISGHTGAGNPNRNLS